MKKNILLLIFIFAGFFATAQGYDINFQSNVHYGKAYLAYYMGTARQIISPAKPGMEIDCPLPQLLTLVQSIRSNFAARKALNYLLIFIIY